MVGRMENTVTDDAAVLERTVPDSNKLRGHEASGERVYRRRIRSLKDLPVDVVPPPVFPKERGLDAPASMITSNCSKASEGKAVVKGKPPRSQLKTKCASSNGGTPWLKVSPIEVQPELGQIGSELSRLHRGTSDEPGSKGPLNRKVAKAPSSIIPSKAVAKAIGHPGCNGKLPKPLGDSRQSTLDHFFKDPPGKTPYTGRGLLSGTLAVKALKGSGTLPVKRPGTLGVKVDVLWPPPATVENVPPKPKRKRTVGLDKLKAPPKGNVFPSIPEDEDFLPLRRPKIRRKEAQEGSPGVLNSADIEVPSKKRSLPKEKDFQSGEKSLDIGKRSRKVPTHLSMRTAANFNTNLLGFPGNPAGAQRNRELLKVSKQALGGAKPKVARASVTSDAFDMTNSIVAPITVPLEVLGIPLSNPCPVSVSVEALRRANPKSDPVRVPVGSLGIPVSNRATVNVPVEELRSPGCNEDRVSAAGKMKQLISNGRANKAVSKIKKDGTPDGRFKANRSMCTALGNQGVQPVDQQTLNRENHAKKLPEVQKNGVRKPKRVQLKRLFIDKPAPRPPSPNSGTNPRVVKALWSRPTQMERMAEVVDSRTALVPARVVKSTKFLSLQQIDASEKLNQPRAKGTFLDVEDSEGNESDRTVSDSPPTATQQFAPLSSVIGKKQIQAPGARGVHQSTPRSNSVKKTTEGGKKNLLVKTRRCKTVAQNTIKGTLKRRKDGSGGLDLTPKTEKLIAVQRTERATENDIRQADQSNVLDVNKVVIIEQAKFQQQMKQQLESCVNDNAIGDPERSPKKAIKPASPEPMSSGEFEGPNGVPRMTPRTRKLTDAMQNFLHQKATLLLQWKEMELGKLHPMALIGRSCKIFWPLDNEWYPGVIHEYNPQTRRHRIDYEDDEREWVSLGKERVKLYVSAEESKTLEMSFGEGAPLDQGKKLDADELAVLAAGHEGCHGELNHGDLVWAKVKGYPMWPACVMDEEHAGAGGMESSPRERTVPVQFFGSYDYARINAKKVVPFAKGIMHKYHSKCKRTVFEQGLQEIERYLKECKLPDQMAQLQEDVIPVVTKKADDLTSNDESDEEGGNESVNVLKKTLEIACIFPLELGPLRVLTLGKIVKDSEQFHTENHIWTEGYTAVRQFASMKDPEKIVEYKMEVLRNPTMPSLPLFRVTPEDEKPVEASTASGCWKRILIKIQRAKEKAGLCIATLLEKKRQSFRSGPSMFGFSHRKVLRLIQALPNARACSKFTAWIDKLSPEDGDEEVAPAGYRPVEVNWKHLDRCNICYLDEEYADNQLLQCDKCRTMVHMYCYGELEPPDGDLWLCNLCRPEAPKRSPLCCLCPVTGGAMKPTTDGRWAHLTCAMWTPETCLVDVKRMEPVDGINCINKERWKLVCTICKVPYGACIQCSKPNCRVAFHPLCARGAGLSMEVSEDKGLGCSDVEGGFQLLTFCKKHSLSMSQGSAVRIQSQQTAAVSQGCLTVSPIPSPPQSNPSGCARCDPYNAASRRGHRQPEAVAAALAKRFFVENKPYFVTGCQGNVPDRELKSLGGSLWSRHWKQSKSGTVAQGGGTSADDDGDNGKAPQSMSERYRHMRSTMHERLTFGKSSIHGWGVFTKRPHSVGDMVIEYAGEIVRPIIADIRERRSYDSLVGAGTYMFRIDDERVVDATHAGSIAHLINHSCEPNCYSRVVTASGDDHIIIFAKRDIREGEELTYDYRFASKDELLTCYCGCSGCRGFVNSFEREEEPPRIRAPRSELTKWFVS